MAVRVPGHVPLSAGVTRNSVAVGSAVALTTNTTANVTSQTLAPGTYLIWGTVDFAEAASTVTLEQAGINTASATLPTQAAPVEALSTRVMATSVATQTDQLDVRPLLITLASTTTVFLVAQATFSAGAVSAYGTLVTMQISLP